MAEQNVILHDKSYLVLTSEEVWGEDTHDEAGQTDRDYIWMPANTYSVEPSLEHTKPQPVIGLRQTKGGQKKRYHVAGQMASDLYGYVPPGGTESLAETLLEWAMASPEAIYRPSYTGLWSEQALADKKHRGLRVNSFTLTGDEGSGITCNWDLLGKDEVAVADVSALSSLPTDMEELLVFEYTDASFVFNGSALPLHNFQLQMSHGLAPTFRGSTTPELMPAGQWGCTFNFTATKSGSTYDTLRRSFDPDDNYHTGVLTLKGLHNGTGSTGNYTVVTLTMNKLRFADKGNNRSFGQIVQEPMQFEVNKPDTSADAVVRAYSEAE